MSFVVRHRNPIVTSEEWSHDGVGASWTRKEAEAHVIRCEFDAQGIEYEIVPVEVMANKAQVETATKAPSGNSIKRSLERARAAAPTRDEDVEDDEA